jgi:hypothetical protein
LIACASGPMTTAQIIRTRDDDAAEALLAAG